MDDNVEQWRACPGWPNYEVSNLGRVRSLWKRADGSPRKHHSGGVLAQTRDHRGYMRVCLCRDGRKHHLFVHRLVLEAFVGPCPPGFEADHVDGDPANNHLDNLRWLLREENQARRRPARGESHGSAKLTEIQVREVHALRAQGLSQRKIAAKFGVHWMSVNCILRGKTWGHLHPSADGRAV